MVHRSGVPVPTVSGVWGIAEATDAPVALWRPPLAAEGVAGRGVATLELFADIGTSGVLAVPEGVAEPDLGVVGV